ncbi:hypothetical protein JZ751_009356 [Albula glossodonta]|uniref:CCDC92/74 N-terminal domain-containing protein n=1 Tax=Albula glossodonta TaxID=121402 RepID=A0A8T2N1I2_9TELE|nr:hypothetical protein JZ751_009356 [Albula glossodonta]
MKAVARPRGGGGAGITMETGPLARQLESVERNMAFLRQEHLALLRGLHLEILVIQYSGGFALHKKILPPPHTAPNLHPTLISRSGLVGLAKLTCELNLKPAGRTQAGEDYDRLENCLNTGAATATAALCCPGTSILYDLMQWVGVQWAGFEEVREGIGELRRELSQKGALAGALRAALKDRERRFLEELKRRSHKIASLNGELQRQTDAAARLSFQLYAARQSLFHQQEAQERASRGSGRAERPPPSPPLPPTPPPVPPMPATRPKRRSHRPPAVVRAERARECVPRERVTGPEDPAPMPDPALFLYPRRQRPRQRHAHRPRPPGDGPEEGGRPRSRLNSTPTAGVAAEAE